MSEAMTGGCACGKVRFTARVENDEAYLCHCRMCQRATGSVSIAFKNMKKADVAWESEPDWYRSSPIAGRPYCAACGTSLGFAFPDSDNMDLTIAAFDDPSRFKPQQFSAWRACIGPGSTPRACPNIAPTNISAGRPLGEGRCKLPD